jgi:hypothetical protein
MGQMTKEGFSRAAIEETKYLKERPSDKVWEEKKRGVEFPGHKKVKAVIQRHAAMLHHNQASGCLPCQYGTAKNLQTGWRRTGTGAPCPTWRRVQTPVPTTPLSGAPPTPTIHTSWAQPSEIVNLPAGYTYSQTVLPCAKCFEGDQDTKHDNDFDPDMLTVDG